MKTKLLLFLIVCSSVFVFTNVNTTNYSVMLSLVDIESLAKDEIDDGTLCVEVGTLVATKNQECSVYDRTYEAPYREDVVYKCKGAAGSGTCHEGHVYHYYDCEGYYIDSDDRTYIAQCKDEG